MFQQLFLDVLNFVPTYSATSSHFFPRQSRSNEQWKSGPTATTHELHVTCLRSHISGEPGEPGEPGVVVLWLWLLWLYSNILQFEW